MTKHWVLGASWGVIEHQDERFVREGFWSTGLRPIWTGTSTKAGGAFRQSMGRLNMMSGAKRSSGRDLPNEAMQTGSRFSATADAETVMSPMESNDVV